jgi:hypothetical protein
LTRERASEAVWHSLRIAPTTFDDLPAEYQANIDYEPPFGRRPGQPPALSDQSVSGIVAFLRTLTDGFEPPARSPAQADGRRR